MRGAPRHLGVFVNLREPETYYSLEDFDTELGEEELSSKSKEKKKGAAYVRTLRENAKDGVIVECDYELGGSSYVVLDSANIKSATDNRGTFDGEDADITHSLIDITQAARVMMKRREDDMEGEELITRWDKLLQLMETASSDRRDGAARLGALVALLESTRSVLPPEYARLGRLNALMKWAAVYTHLISTGEVKRDGLLKGAIFDKFAAAMQRKYEGSLQNGVSEQEAKQAMQDLGERRLEEAKVARECRTQLDTFVKARARERIELMAERAYPKKREAKSPPAAKWKPRATGP